MADGLVIISEGVCCERVVPAQIHEFLGESERARSARFCTHQERRKSRELAILLHAVRGVTIPLSVGGVVERWPTDLKIAGIIHTEDASNAVEVRHANTGRSTACVTGGQNHPQFYFVESLLTIVSL